LDGRYTGKTVGIPSFQGGKVTRLNDWIAEHQHSLEGSYFYSDSHNDLPLLRIVDHPVAVDPDDTLKAAAEAAGWPIISLRVAE
jgi:phosphoserine phosphatase